MSDYSEHMYIAIIIGLVFYISMLVYVAYLRRNKIEIDLVLTAFMVTIISFMSIHYKLKYINEQVMKDTFV